MEFTSSKKYWTDEKLTLLTEQYNSGLMLLDICKLHMYTIDGSKTKITAGGVLYQLSKLMDITDSNRYKIRGFVEYRNSDIYKTAHDIKYPDKPIISEYKLTSKQLNKQGKVDIIEHIEKLPDGINNDVVNEIIKTNVASENNKYNKPKLDKIKLDPINSNEVDNKIDIKQLVKLYDDRLEQYVNILRLEFNKHLEKVDFRVNEHIDIITKLYIEDTKKADYKFYTMVRLVTKLHNLLKLKLPEDDIYNEKHHKMIDP